MSDKLAEIISSGKAPRVETEPLELTDHRISPEEAVIAYGEKCLRLASKHKIGGQDELEDPDRACGPRLQFTEIISRLKREAPRLFAVEGSPGNIALYYPRNAKELEDAREDWESERDEFFLYHKYVGGFPKQQIQEYATVDIDSSHLATRENRGWRSILITLLKQGVLSYHQAIRQFGDVGTDRRGWRWKEQTKPWRDNPHIAFPQSRAFMMAGDSANDDQRQEALERLNHKPKLYFT